MNPTIEEVDVNALIPYARNSRTHSDDQVSKIAASIKEFGFTNPILVDGENVIIAGHCRVLAAQRLGLKKVPVVSITHLTESQKRAYIIADNRLALDSGWDEEMLKVELEAIGDDFDLQLTGFDESEIDKLLNEDVTDAEECDVPELQEEPICKTGQLWKLGNHRLLCGDSTSSEDVSSLADGELFDMLLTDPPYGVGYVGIRQDRIEIENDDLSEDELSVFCGKVFDNADENLRDGSYWYATVAPGPLHLLFADDWKRRGVLKQILVWVKNHWSLGRSEYHYQHEPILFGWKDGKRHKNEDRTRTSVWQHDKPAASREHPTMKPVSLWSQAIKDGSRKGEKVFDPFAGSGTSFIACEQLDRKCYGIEHSPQYCDVIISRWETLTGKKAQLC